MTVKNVNQFQVVIIPPVLGYGWLEIMMMKTKRKMVMERNLMDLLTGHGSGSNGNGNGGNQSSNGGSSNGSNGGGGGVSESTYIPRRTGNIITAMLAWRGSQYSLQMFFPHIKTPSRREVQDQVRKVYPNAKLWNYKVSDYDPGEPLLQIGGRKN